MLVFIGRGSLKLGTAIALAAVTAAVGVLVPRVISGGGAAASSHSTPKFCTIRGIDDSGYLNAALTGRSTQVAAVAVWIVDESKWYFKAAQRSAGSWSAPANPSELWEVGQPGDPPQTTFIFAMLARAGVAKEPLPAEDQGLRRIPNGFRIVGDRIPLSKRDLLNGGLDHRC